MAEGFGPFRKEYEEASLLMGKRIKFVDHGKHYVGVAESIGADGTIFMHVEEIDGLAVDKAAEPMGFLSGEVSRIEIVPGLHVVEGHHDGKH